MAAGVRTPNVPPAQLMEVLGHYDAGGGRKALGRSSLNALVDALRSIIANDPSGVATLRADFERSVANLQRSVDVTAEGVAGALRKAEEKQPAFDLAGLRSTVSSLATARQQQAQRTAAVEGTVNQVAERSIRYSSAATSLSAPSRPGETPILWTHEVVALPERAMPISPDLVAFGTGGSVVRLAGAGAVGPIGLFRIESGRTYSVRFVIQRRANPPDPSNDAVRLALNWFGQGKASIAPAQAIVADLRDLTVSAGRQTRTIRIATASGSNVDLVAPSGAIYFRPFVQAFGGTTDVEVIEYDDVTSAGMAAPDTSIFESRIAKIEGLDAGARLDALEVPGGGSKVRSFITVAEAKGEVIPAAVSSLWILSHTVGGEAVPAAYRRALGQPTTADSFQSADGAWWELYSRQEPTNVTYSTAGREAPVTISIGSPAVITWPNHGLANNDRVIFTTTGKLPDGLALFTFYFVTNRTPTGFNLAAGPTSSPIATSGSQSGTHTLTAPRVVGPRYVTGTAGSGLQDYLWLDTIVLHNTAKGGQNVGRYTQSLKQGAGPTWGEVIEVRDQTHEGSPTGALQALEIDVCVNGPDFFQTRCAIPIVAWRDDPDAADGAIGAAISLATNATDQGHIKFVNGLIVQAGTTVTNGINLVGATIEESAFASPGFSVDRFGNVIGHALSTEGQLTGQALVVGDGADGFLRVTSSSGVVYLQSGSDAQTSSALPLVIGPVLGGEWARFTPVGLALPTGAAIKIEDQQVVGKRRPAIANAAAEVGSLGNTVNAILNAMRLHGLIGA